MTTTMKKRTRAEAKKLMWEYYRENKPILPRSIREHREEILKMLSNGLNVDAAYATYVRNAHCDTT